MSHACPSCMGSLVYGCGAWTAIERSCPNGHDRRAFASFAVIFSSRPGRETALVGLCLPTNRFLSRRRLSDRPPSHAVYNPSLLIVDDTARLDCCGTWLALRRAGLRHLIHVQTRWTPGQHHYVMQAFRSVDIYPSVTRTGNRACHHPVSQPPVCP